MAAVLGFFLILLALTGHSSATTYCVCKDEVSESALQKDINYACGNGANCSPIKEKGVCYNPNTAKDHCNYAVNSYYQNKGQAVGSCDFDGTAVTTQAVGVCYNPNTAKDHSAALPQAQVQHHQPHQDPTPAPASALHPTASMAMAMATLITAPQTISLSTAPLVSLAFHSPHPLLIHSLERLMIMMM